MSRFIYRVLLISFTFFLSVGNAQTHKGFTFQAFIKQPDGHPLNVSGIPLQLQVLSPNDCILYDETHSSISVNEGYLNLVVGEGTRSSGDPGFSMSAIFNNKASKPNLNSISGGSGTCTYTPTAGGQDGRRLRVIFNAFSDVIDVNFNIRSTAFAVESERLEGKSASEFIQTSPKVSQSVLEDFFDKITTSTNQGVIWNGSGFSSYDPKDGTSLTGVPWNSLTGVPSPLLGIAGLNCANNEILKWNGAAWTCAADSAGVGTVTSVNAQAPLNSSGGGAPLISLSAGSVAGQTLRWDGSAWVAQKLNYVSDVVNSNSLSPWPASSCGVHEFLIWSSVSDSFACSGVGDATSTQKGLVQIGSGLNVTAGVVSLSATGVTAGTYGSASTIPQIQVDAQGRVVAATAVSVNDNTKLPLAGGTLSGDINMSGNNLLYTGYITMNAGKSLHLSNNVSDPVGLAAADAGKIWYNSTTNSVKFWDGSSAKNFIAKTCATGEILKFDGSDWACGNAGVGNNATLGDAKIWLGDGANKAQEVGLVGDATLSNAGVLTLSPSGATAGTYSKVTVDAKGRVTVGASIGSSDVTTALGYSPLNKDGDVMTGSIGLGNYTNATEATLISGYGVGDKGKTWFNTTTNQVKYWDGSAAQALGISGAGLTSLGGQTGSTQTFATGTSGTAPAWSSASNIHTLNIPMASSAGTTAGLLNKTDYDAFNAKQNAGNYITALTGDVTGAGPGSAAATIAANAITTAKILDGTILGTDMNYTGVNAGTSGIVIKDNTGKFFDFSCGTAGHVATWTVSGWACQAPSPLLPSLASGKIWIGDGVNAAVAQTMSGDATISMAGALTLANSGVTTGTYSKVTIDAKGRVTVGSNIGSSDVTTALGYTPLNKAGDVMSGLLGLNGVTSDPTGLVAADKGKVWYRTDTNEIKYWNGASAIALGAAGSGLQSLNGLSVSAQTFATGTTGTDFNISSSGSAHTFSLPSASGVNRGLLTSADWTTFNAKLDAVSNSANLANTKIWVGDGAGKAQEVSMSGDATISNTGAVTVNNVRVDRMSSAAGQYLSYKPNNVACASNEVLKWNGTGWICGIDNAGTGTVTGVTATAPLASSGGAAPVISISNGSTTGQTLRWNGSAWVAAQLSNSDVTGLGSLATKNSVDLSTADATGTLAAARMPALTGDVTSTAGSLATTLANSGVTAGTYSKVTVDAKGRVTVGANIGASDVTTALGYTPLNKAGDVMTGSIGLGNYTNATEATLVAGYGAGDKGKTWFNTTTNQVKYWDGSAAQALGVSGAGLTSLGGQTGSTQTFAIGTSGTAPTWSSASNTHTLNIPMASSAGTTAGLLSKTDYDAFNAKQAAGNYVTALTGDVTASGPGSAAATIAANAVTTGKILDGTVLGADLNYTGVNAGTSGIVIKDSTGKFFDFACGTAGHVATWTVSGWACQAPSPLLPSLTSGKIWIGDGTNAAVAQTMSGDATISTAGALTLANSGVTAGTYSKVTVDAKGRVTTGASIASSDVTTALGYTPVNAAGDTMSGDLTFSGTKGLKLKDTSGPESVYIKSPGTLTGSYTLTLPTQAPTAGQMLQSDASGNLSWTSSAGGVTSVTASTPLSSSGGATPNITISQANAATDGYISSTDWNAFNAKLGTSGGTMTGMLTLATGTTTLSPMRIPAGTLVTTPVSGNIESDGSSLYWTNNTSARQKLASYTGTAANGQLLIGTGAGFSLANITAGSGISVTNSSGGITIAATGGTGTVTSVSSANSDISVATGTTTPVLTLNSGTAGGAGDANKIAKLDASGLLTTAMIPNHDTSKLTSGTLPIARGGTNNGSLGVTAGGILYMDGSKMMTTAAGTSGQALISAGAGVPAFGTLGLAAGGTGATTAAAARTNLGLGTAATQNTGSASGNVPLIGVSGITNNMMCTSDGTGSVICNTAIPTGSQWTTSGSNIYYSTGNVGMGTTPYANSALHVARNGTSRATFGTNGAISTASTVVELVTKDGMNSGLAVASSKGWEIEGRGDAWSTAANQNDLFFTFWNGLIPSTAMVIDSVAGNVGIGTTTPVSKLQVAGGALTTAYSAISSLTVDFSTANVISTTAAAGTLVLNNMQDGTSYTLIVQNTGSYTLSGSSVSTWRCAPSCSGGVISNTSGHVLVTILKAGTTAYVSYISDM